MTVSRQGDTRKTAQDDTRKTARTEVLAVRGPGRVRTLLARQEATLIGVLVAIGVLAALRNSTFGQSQNLTEVLRAAVVTFIIACPLTLVTIGGGFDFSVGSIFTFGSVSAAYFMVHGITWPLAVVLALLVGAALGFVNATIIQRLRVPPIITTLGTFYFLSGLVIIFTNGIDISPLPRQFDSLGSESLLGLPNIVIAGVVVGVGYHVVLEHTRFGYNVRAMGGNRLAATENGIPVGRIEVWIYVGAGIFAALAGIVYTARTGSGQVSAGGAGVTLTAISAVLIGGTSLFGGLGTILGTALGALLFAEVDNALTVTNVNPLYANMVIGGVLILAVAADSLRRGRMFSLRR
jgi:ribose transport system permease protein